ncbi:MAG TPA: hypothetical protein VHN37_00080 [Actinomycetota bacterium]|nr:hypothetical protein [Actinomycetota bacterium]
MKLLAAPLATLLLMSLPNPAPGQAGELGSLPEGTLLLSHCPEDQARGDDTCQVADPILLTTDEAPELFSLDPVGEQQVTDNDLYEFGSAAWSPSGKKLALSGGPRFDVEECRAYVVTTSTGTASPITPDVELACPFVEDWSPDGRWILMTVRFHDGPVQLYKVRPDGTRLRALTDYDYEDQWVEGAQLIHDGRKILYWGDPGRREGIGVMRSDGRFIRTLVRLRSSRSSPKILGEVSVAPDDRRVAFVVYDGFEKTHEPDEVFVIDLAGRTRRRLTFNETDETALSWGPSSKRVAVVQGSMYGAEPAPVIKIIPVGAGPVVKLRRPAEGAIDRWSAPVWSPSGDHVAFMVEDDTGDAAYVGNTRNGEITRVTDFHYPFELFSWTP